MDQATKLKFSSYVHLPSTCMNNIFRYCYARVILRNVGKVIIIFEHGRYISALEHIRMLIFSSNVHLA